MAFNYRPASDQKVSQFRYRASSELPESAGIEIAKPPLDIRDIGAKAVDYGATYPLAEVGRGLTSSVGDVYRTAQKGLQLLEEIPAIKATVPPKFRPSRIPEYFAGETEKTLQAYPTTPLTETVPGQILQGIGASPATIAEYSMPEVAGVRSPALAMALVNAIRGYAPEKGARNIPKMATEAGKGYMMGKFLEASAPLKRAVRLPALAAMGAAEAAPSGKPKDIATSSILYPALGFEGEGQYGPREIAAPFVRARIRKSRLEGYQKLREMGQGAQAREVFNTLRTPVAEVDPLAIRQKRLQDMTQENALIDQISKGIPGVKPGQSLTANQVKVYAQNKAAIQALQFEIMKMTRPAAAPPPVQPGMEKERIAPENVPAPPPAAPLPEAPMIPPERALARRGERRGIPLGRVEVKERARAQEQKKIEQMAERVGKAVQAGIEKPKEFPPTGEIKTAAQRVAERLGIDLRPSGKPYIIKGKPETKKEPVIEKPFYVGAREREEAPIEIPKPAEEAPAKAPEAKKVEIDRESLISQIDEAIKKADGKGQVDFHIKGDGTFSIFNTKEALTEFKGMVKKIESSNRIQRLKDMTSRLQKPKAIPKVGKEVSKDEIVKNAMDAVAESGEGKVPIRGVNVDESGVTATNGRILYHKEGNFGEKGIFAPDGTKIEEQFPNYKVILEGVEKYKKSTDFNIPETVTSLNQVLAASKGLESQDVRVYVNGDGSLGFIYRDPTTGTEGRVSVQDGAKLASNVNPEFLKRLLEIHLKNGSESAKLSWNEMEQPIKIEGKGDISILMPMRMDTPASPVYREKLSSRIKGQKGFVRIGGFKEPQTEQEKVARLVAKIKGEKYIPPAKPGERKEYPFPKVEMTEPRQRELSGIAQHLEDIKKEIFSVISPPDVSKFSKEGAKVFRSKLGYMARANERVNKALERLSGVMDKRSNQENLDFINRMEKGEIQATPELDTIAKTLREMLDKKRDLVRSLGTGELENFYENYFPHIWEKPWEAAKVVANAVRRKGLTTKPAFLKERVFEYTSEGIDYGLKPLTYNPVELTIAKMAEMERYVMAHRTLYELEKMGLAKYIKGGVEKPIDFERIDPRIGTQWYAQSDVAKIINNHLTPGLNRFKLFRSWRAVGNSLNQFQLGFSAFHLGFTSLDATISKAALAFNYIARGKPIEGIGELLKTPTAPLTNYLAGNKLYKAYETGVGTPLDLMLSDLVAESGGRIKMDRFYANQSWKSMQRSFKDGGFGNVKGIFKLPFALVEQMSKPILEHIVPRQKLGVFSDLMKMELKTRPDMTANELRATAQKIWDSVDNRMGQLVYDNLFWNKVWKDMALASVRSVGWNLGTFREVGGGALDIAKQPLGLLAGKKPELTYRAAYLIALPMVTALYGSLLHRLFTNQNPKTLKDAFFPGKEDERYSLPSYIKDIYHYATSPGRTLANKLNPSLSMIAQMVNNKDYYGVKIRNEDDPLYKKIIDEAKFVAGQFEPFGIRYARQPGQPMGRRFLSFVGITPAPYDISMSAAEKKAMEINISKIGAGGRTSEQYQRSRKKTELEKAFRNKEPNAIDRLNAALQEGTIRQKDVTEIKKEAKVTPLESRVRGMTVEELESVMDKATDEEKRLLEPILRKKKRNRRAKGG